MMEALNSDSGGESDPDDTAGADWTPGACTVTLLQLVLLATLLVAVLRFWGLPCEKVAQKPASGLVNRA